MFRMNLGHFTQVRFKGGQEKKAFRGRVNIYLPSSIWLRLVLTSVSELILLLYIDGCGFLNDNDVHW